MPSSKKPPLPKLTDAHLAFLENYENEYYPCAFQEDPVKARATCVQKAAAELCEEFPDGLDHYSDDGVRQVVRNYFYERVGRTQSLREPRYHDRFTSYNMFQQSILAEIREERRALQMQGDTRTKVAITNELTRARWDKLDEAEQKKWAEKAKESVRGRFTEQQKDKNWPKLPKHVSKFLMTCRETYGAEVVVLAARQSSKGEFSYLMHDHPPGVTGKRFLDDRDSFNSVEFFDYCKNDWGVSEQTSNPKPVPKLIIDEAGYPLLPICDLDTIKMKEFREMMQLFFRVHWEMASGQKGRSPRYSDLEEPIKLLEYIDSEYLPTTTKPLLFKKTGEIDADMLKALYSHLHQRQLDKEVGKVEHVFRFKAMAKHGSKVIQPALYTRDVMRTILELHNVEIPRSLGGPPRVLPTQSQKGKKTKPAKHARAKKAKQTEVSGEEISIPATSSESDDERSSDEPTSIK
ncbi:hypothetical protein K474DRAFT_1712297, partial [Panus rudis PR-1116 ss-1]